MSHAVVRARCRHCCGGMSRQASHMTDTCSECAGTGHTSPHYACMPCVEADLRIAETIATSHLVTLEARALAPGKKRRVRTMLERWVTRLFQKGK